MKTKDRLFNLSFKTRTYLFIFILITILVSIIIGNMFLNSDLLNSDFTNINQSPSLKHIFGTDWMGRDMFIRTMSGLSLSLKVGIFATVISAVLSILIGLFSGINKFTDNFVTMIIDLLNSIPFILLIILICICLGRGYLGVILAIGLTHWIPLAKILRAEIKKIKNSEYIKISKQLGHSKLWISKNHILVLLWSHIIVGTILVFQSAIMHEAAISFLGFGLSPHHPSIGIILSESVYYLSSGYWWLALYPGLVLLVVVLIFDILGTIFQKMFNIKERL